ncbi:MAG: hypothetical protein WBH09_09150 [Rugosibacter sp.]
MSLRSGGQPGARNMSAFGMDSNSRIIIKRIDLFIDAELSALQEALAAQKIRKMPSLTTAYWPRRTP